MADRGAPDPEFCYPAGSGSMPDPDMSDLAGSEPDPSYLDLARSGSKPRLLPTTEEKLLFLHHYWKSWNDCLPYFVTELLLE